MVFFVNLHIQIFIIMTAELFLDEQTLRRLFEGKRVKGSLYAERVDNEVVVGFNPYQRNNANRRHDQTLLTLGHGWLRKSAKRYRLHLSIPDDLGERRVAGLMASETEEAHNFMCALEELLKVV